MTKFQVYTTAGGLHWNLGYGRRSESQKDNAFYSFINTVQVYMYFRFALEDDVSSKWLIFRLRT